MLFNPRSFILADLGDLRTGPDANIWLFRKHERLSATSGTLLFLLANTMFAAVLVLSSLRIAGLTGS